MSANVVVVLNAKLKTMDVEQRRKHEGHLDAALIHAANNLTRWSVGVRARGMSMRIDDG